MTTPGSDPTRKTMRRFILWTIALTMFWEAITLALRFGAGLESTRDTAPYFAKLFLGYRIHHAYIGAVMLPVAWLFYGWKKPWAWAVLAMGLSLIASDLIHHFLVLWPITGDPEFHLVYPPSE